MNNFHMRVIGAMLLAGMFAGPQDSYKPWRGMFSSGSPIYIPKRRKMKGYEKRGTR